MGLLSRWFRRLSQSDEERLSQEVREWAGTVPGTTRLAECPDRMPIRVAGVVRRMTISPGSLEALVSDGTGEVVASWTGRDHIPGLGLGTQLVLEGVLGRDRQRDVRKMVNPKFEFG